MGRRGVGLLAIEGGERSKNGFSGESRTNSWRLAALVKILDEPADCGVTGGSGAVVWRRDGGGDTGALTL